MGFSQSKSRRPAGGDLLRDCRKSPKIVILANCPRVQEFIPTAGALMTNLGPGEESSDAKRKDKAITKTDNSRCGKAIIESVQHY